MIYAPDDKRFITSLMPFMSTYFDTKVQTCWFGFYKYASSDKIKYYLKPLAYKKVD